MISFWVMVFFLIGDSACSSSEMTAKEGSCVTVHVTLSKTKHSGYIVWLKDAVWNVTAKEYEGTIVHSLKPDKPAASEFENRVSVGSTGDLYELTISNLRLEDSGKYMVRYYDEDDPSYKLSSSTMSLNVQDAPKEVRITASGTLEGIYEGAAVNLTCEVQSSNPSVRSYSWYRNHTVLLETGPVLRFPAVRPKDRGSYRCQASNSVGSEDSPEVTITVHYGPRGTKIKASCCEKGVKAGESLTLTCETNARPKPDGYTWFRTITEPGGQRGPGRTEVAVSSNGRSDGRYLRFWQISAGDAGEYTCQAKNTISAQNSTALRVDVLYLPKNTSVSVSPSGSVLAGSSVTLTCSSNANPAVQNYTWYKVNGTEINTVGTGQNLTFNVTESSGSEQYYCEAQNEHGKENSTTVQLNVIYMPQISGSGSCSRTEAEISCSCESRGNPSPSMEWRVSGLRVTNSTERVIREEQLGNTGLRSSLTMRQSQGDTPTLLCVSTNTLGNSSLQLHIPSPQQHSGFTSLLIGAAASAGAMMMICLIMQLVLKIKFQSTVTYYHQRTYLSVCADCWILYPQK